ncbi:MAG TPA: hypothetical protein VGH51_15245, partial [Candidatus Angelobacter sp.]
TLLKKQNASASWASFQISREDRLCRGRRRLEQVRIESNASSLKRYRLPSTNATNFLHTRLWTVSVFADRTSTNPDASQSAAYCNSE